MNDSSTGGFLAPAPPPPDNDIALQQDVQATVAGISGLALALVLPRWQPKMPPQPEVTVNWCAVGVLSYVANAGRPAVLHGPGTGQGADVLTQWEDLEVLCSFYGPAAEGYATLVRDGIWVAQNREAMAALGLRLRGVGRVAVLPQLSGELWQRRADLPLTLARAVTRTYPVLDLLQAEGTVVRALADGTEDTAPWQAGPVQDNTVGAP